MAFVTEKELQEKLKQWKGFVSKTIISTVDGIELKQTRLYIFESRFGYPSGSSDITIDILYSYVE